MSTLTKFNPFTRTEPLDLFHPSFRADNFRDMEDIARNMQCMTREEPRKKTRDSQDSEKVSSDPNKHVQTAP